MNLRKIDEQNREARRRLRAEKEAKKILEQSRDKENNSKEIKKLDQDIKKDKKEVQKTSKKSNVKKAVKTGKNTALFFSTFGLSGMFGVAKLPFKAVKTLFSKHSSQKSKIISLTFILIITMLFSGFSLKAQTKLRMTQLVLMGGSTVVVSGELKDGTSASDAGTKTSGLEDGESSANIDARIKEVDEFYTSEGRDLTKAQRAAVIGNFGAESQINPKRFEGDYLATNKEEVWNKIAENEGDPAKVHGSGWAGFLHATNPAAYFAPDAGHNVMGIGLGQWTGPRGFNLIKFVNKDPKKLANLKNQLKFMVEEKRGGFDGHKENMFSSGSLKDVATAVTEFLTIWEGNSGNKLGERIAFANGVMDKLK